MHTHTHTNTHTQTHTHTNTHMCTHTHTHTHKHTHTHTHTHTHKHTLTRTYIHTHTHTSQPKQTVECILCEFVMRELDSLISSNSTEVHVHRHLHEIMLSLVPFSISHSPEPPIAKSVCLKIIFEAISVLCALFCVESHLTYVQERLMCFSTKNFFIIIIMKNFGAEINGTED